MSGKKRKIVLASGSPRRKDLLKQAGLDFEVCVSPAEEIIPENMNVYAVPEYLAKLKLSPVLDQANPGELVIAADTVVIFNGEIYGKPADRDAAVQMLKSLSGQMHTVVSGVAFAEKGGKVHSFSSKTDVYFYPFDQALIESYVDHFKPFDKAGSYAIQELIGLVGVEKINGCFYNVIGLPVSKLMQELKKYT